MSDEISIENQLKALKVAKIYYKSHLEDEVAVDYLAARGISAAAIKRFEIGYAPDKWRGLVDHYSYHTIRLAAREAGVIKNREESKQLFDFFRGRLMFPIRSIKSNEVVGYGGRIVNSDTPNAAKYLNTPETALFNKSELLYGLYENYHHINDSKEAIQVEGYMDVIGLNSAGFEIGVAPMGTALTDQQIKLLADMGVKTMWICLDGDKAGIKATQRSLDVILASNNPFLEVRVIQLEGGHDPDSYIKEHGAQAFRVKKDNALKLPEYIHQVLCAGIPEKPCLEDKALYLSRLDAYVDQCGGVLLNKLLDQASAYTGLAIKDMSDGKYERKRMTDFAEWHPLVSHAARWMLHDKNSRKIAERFKSIPEGDKGLSDLAKMANELLNNANPTTVLHQFAKLHGPLLKEEMEDLNRNWSSWYKPTVLENHLKNLNETPDDQATKRAIKSMILGA